MNPWYSLEEKTIWVTGGAGYLGTPISEALDGLCGKLVCIDLEGRAEALVRDHKLARTIPVSLNVSNLDKLPGFIDEMIAAHGVPDGLVHMAFASTRGKRLNAISAEDFRGSIDQSLTSAYILCRTLGERMKARGRGSVVLFSSMYGVVSPDPRIYVDPNVPNPIDYGVAKAGVLQMTRYFAVHYGPSGVRFNAVTPGPFPNVPGNKYDTDFMRTLSAKVPMGRVGRSSEMVGPVLFLLGDGASYVTGQSLVVDGGWTVW